MWTHPHGGRRRVAAVVAGLVVAVAATATAPEVRAASEPVRSLVLPGTPQALGGSLGLDAVAVERRRFMLELVRHLWGWNGGWQNRAAFERLVLEVKGLQAYRAAWFAAKGRDNAIGLVDARSSKKVRAFLEVAGLRLVESKMDRRPAVVVDDSPAGARARDAIAASGIDIGAAAATLNRGARLNFSLSSFTVPLPLAPSVWRREILHMSVDLEWLFAAILARRDASLLYYGLLSLDPDTLAFLAEQPRLAEEIAANHAAVFAVYGRSLHLRNGRIVVPGGEIPGVVGLWEELVGSKVTEPARFMERLLGARDGRLAYLYDVIQHLDRPHQLFALGTLSQAQVARDARQHMEQFLELLSRPDAAFDPRERPFLRPAVDLFVVLASIRVTPEGRLAPPAEATTWVRILPDDVRGAGALSAPALASMLISRDPAGRLWRLRLFLFAQRVFAEAPPEDVSQVALALKDYPTFPLLFSVIERMGVRKPSSYSAAAVWARRLTGRRDPEIAATSLTEFQAAIALLDRCAFARRLTPAGATALLDRLLELRVDADGSYAGSGVTGWLTAHLLPALEEAGGGTAADSPRERTLLRALAGVSSVPTARPVFVWRDADYQYDPGEVEYRRMSGVRRRQGGHSLDQILDLAALVDELRASDRTAASGRAALAGISTFIERLGKPGANGGRREPAPALDALAASIGEALGELRPGADLRRLDGVAAAVDRLLEPLLAATLRSIVYAVHVGKPDSPVLLDGDVSLQHDLGTASPLPEQRELVPWLVASNSAQPGRWRGSLLALDLAFWRLSFRAPSNEPPVVSQQMAEDDAVALGRTPALFNPYAVTDEDVREIALAIERGRLRVDSALKDANGAALPSLAVEAGLSEWVQHTLPWAVELDRESARSAFALSHLCRLGRPDDDRSPGVGDRWGTFQGPLTGELALREPPAGAWETYADRAGAAYLSVHVADMQLHVAQWLAQMKLPAALARGILPVAMQDLRDGARLAHSNDCRSAARYAVEYAENRFSDIVSALGESEAMTLSGRQPRP